MLRTGAEHQNICRNDQTMFRKVQSTEISFVKGYGALHLEKILIDFSTNIEVLCTSA